jgi:hypothetical protein
MEVVAAVDGCGQTRRPLGVPRHRVEVDHGVEPAARADPCVDRLALGFALRREVARIRESLEGHDRDAVHPDAVGVGAFDDSRVGANDVVGCCRGLALRTGAGSRSNVVDALQDDEPSHAGLRQHITVEPREGARSQSVAKQAVSPNPGVQDRHMDRGWRRLQAPGEDVGPAIVAVGR